MKVCNHIYGTKAKRLAEITRRLSLNSEEVPKPCLLEHSEVKATEMRRRQCEVLRQKKETMSS